MAPGQFLIKGVFTAPQNAFKIKLLLRHRYYNFQHKDSAFAFDGALSVVFFCRAFDVGQSEAVEEGVLLGGSA